MYLDKYNEFIKQFKMVGSNVIFLRNDFYLENECSGYQHIEKNQNYLFFKV